ncbi:MAG: L,D-transpeptidase family protein [Deltaproteobacteria bacterium]|nr:L,D-transpeptidase family protein [Deltaproteobacteria bacterium]
MVWKDIYCKLYGGILISLIFLISFSVPANAWTSSSASRQALVVKTANWKAHQGTLQCYERSSTIETWQAVGDLIPVVAGRSGLGWGVGLHSANNSEGPQKWEGDGRAPAGVFRLRSAFGYAPAKEAAGIKLPYMQATPSLRCVDDAQSRHYNRIVDSGLIKPNWKSDEEMRREDDQYRLGIIVDHNANPVIPGRGSCIFIHIRKESDAGTAGCTAMSQENMERLLHWLDPSANPVLIQLPEGTYRKLRTAWGLP